MGDGMSSSTVQSLYSVSGKAFSMLAYEKGECKPL